MKYPQQLLKLAKLQGGQFGSLDVTAVSDRLVELDFSADFVRLSPLAARKLIAVLEDWLAAIAFDAVAAATEPGPDTPDVIVIVDRR